MHGAMSVLSDLRLLLSEMIIFLFRCLLLLLSMTRTRAVQNNDGSSNGPSNRTTWDIVRSCLATIFACTWLAVHPNVPSRYMREKGRLFLGPHRVQHMLLAIICPEVVIMWAFRQRFVASVLSKHLKLSMTHGFFISRGGFVGKDERPITTADFFVPKAEELMDKSKGDALSKGISLLQTTWFVVHYISRITLPLPRTQLETATLAFALLNFCNYILWWHKPLDVQYPLQGKAIEDMGIEWTQFDTRNSTFLSGELTTNDEESWVSSAQPSTDTVLGHEDPVERAAEHGFPAHHICPSLENRSSSLLSSTHNGSKLIPDGRPTPYGSHIPISTCFISTSKQQISMDHIKNHTSESLCNAGFIPKYIPNATLPMLWAGQLNWRQIRYSAYFGGCVGALFGGIHYIGWISSGSLDSSLEQLLWKISSLSIAIIPGILAFDVLTLNKFRWVPLFMRFSVQILIYLCARIYIVVDMFVSLRSLPSAALEEIDWTRYIPHI
ncbi:hypothetical protein DFS33DRAFT_1508887 [Desarmillaria ectypa]|nr:hypothetical protein DFS33DRAFT_1508887 [Desarmillaria ectypa]